MRFVFLSMMWCVVAFPVFAQLSPQLEKNREKLRQQNELAREYGLDRMRNADMIDSLMRAGHLVKIPPRGKGWYLDSDIGILRDANGRVRERYPYPHALRVARPWVKLFLDDEGFRFRRRFRWSSFKVASLIRTPFWQGKLRRQFPGVAARCERDDECSPHLTGSVLDISKRGMRRSHIQWMRVRLDALERCGWVSYIDENAAFHIFVIPTYGQGTCN